MPSFAIRIHVPTSVAFFYSPAAAAARVMPSTWKNSTKAPAADETMNLRRVTPPEGCCCAGAFTAPSYLTVPSALRMRWYVPQTQRFCISLTISLPGAPSRRFASAHMIMPDWQ